jgi:hypothetical protein
MDRVEAHKLAQNALNAIESAGYGVASGHVDTIVQNEVSVESSDTYDIELSYLWEGPEHEEILVICRVTSRRWFQHQLLEASITLQSAEP